MGQLIGFNSIFYLVNYILTMSTYYKLSSSLHENDGQTWTNNCKANIFLQPTKAYFILEVGYKADPNSSNVNQFNRTVRLFQIQPKGFKLRLDWNFNLFYVVSYVVLFWRQIFELVWCNWDKVFLGPNFKLGVDEVPSLDYEHATQFGLKQLWIGPTFHLTLAACV